MFDSLIDLSERRRKRRLRASVTGTAGAGMYESPQKSFEDVLAERGGLESPGMAGLKTFGAEFVGKPIQRAAGILSAPLTTAATIAEKGGKAYGPSGLSVLDRAKELLTALPAGMAEGYKAVFRGSEGGQRLTETEKDVETQVPDAPEKINAALKKALPEKAYSLLENVSDGQPWRIAWELTADPVNVLFGGPIDDALRAAAAGARKGAKGAKLVHEFAFPGRGSRGAVGPGGRKGIIRKAEPVKLGPPVAPKTSSELSVTDISKLPDAERIAIETEAMTGKPRPRPPLEVAPVPSSKAASEMAGAEAALDIELKTEAKVPKPVPPPVSPEAPKIEVEPKDIGKLGRMGQDLVTQEEALALQYGPEKAARMKGLIDTLKKRSDVSDFEVEMMVNDLFQHENKLTGSLKKIPYVGERLSAWVSKQARTKLPARIAKQFGVMPERRAVIQDATEAIKQFRPDGTPEFGTRDFLKNPDGSVAVDEATGLPMLHPDRPGGWRFSPEQGKELWDNLAPEEKFLVRKAREEFDAAKTRDLIDVGIEEGYVPWISTTKQTKIGMFGPKLAMPRPGFLKTRTGAGFEDRLRDIEEVMRQRIKSSKKLEVQREILPKLADEMAVQIPEGGLPEGWVALDDFTNVNIAGKPISEVLAGKMMPERAAKEFLLLARGGEQLGEWSQTFKRVQSYIEANLLLGVPGTPIRNIYSGMQSAIMRVTEDVMGGIVDAIRTGSPKAAAKPLKDIAAAAMDVFRPKVVRELTPELLGTARSQAAKYGEGKGLAGATIDTLLKPLQWVDTLFSRFHAAASLRKWGIPIDKRAILADSENVYRMGKELRVFVGMHDDLPKAIKLFRDRIPLLGPMFTSYPYIMSRQITRYVNAFNPLAKLSGRDRFARMMTAAALGIPAYYLQKRGEKGETFEGIPYSLSRSGRALIGKTPEGKEKYLKTRDIGPVTFTGEMATGVSNVLQGRGGRRLGEALSDQVSLSPFLSGVMHIAGLRTRFEYEMRGGKMVPKDTLSLIGKDLKSVIPFGRATEQAHEMLGGPKVDPRDFWENLSRALPLPWGGKIRMNPETGQPQMLDPTREMLQYFVGLNVAEIDPDQYDEAVQRRVGTLMREVSKADLTDQFERDRLRGQFMELDPKLAAEVFDGIGEDGSLTATEKHVDILMPNSVPAPAQPKEPAAPAGGSGDLYEMSKRRAERRKRGVR